MPQKKILVTCPNPTDKQELNSSSLQNEYDIIFDPYTGEDLDKLADKENITLPNHQKILDDIISQYNLAEFEGIINTSDYPGALFQSIICKEWNKKGPNPESIALCQHKYFARQIQKKVVPEATPPFLLLNHKKQYSHIDLPFPIFIKPIKSSFSRYANKIESIEELKKKLSQSCPSEKYFSPLNHFIENYTTLKPCNDFVLVESYLNGIQVTLDGYISNGNFQKIGIVDSHFFPGTICFKEFIYPSQLNKPVQQRMVNITKKFVKAINLDNIIFNIELIYNPLKDTIHIIEINPRMSRQFADLFEKVNGINTYNVLFDILQDKKPTIKQLNSKNYNIAGSFVLRTFSDKKVIKIPTHANIECILYQIPDTRIKIFAKEGKQLGSEKQDGKSFRYALINIGGNDLQDLYEKLSFIKAHLPFSFEDI